jgi:oxygen-independent coproporphyrinogen III oxidase
MKVDFNLIKKYNVAGPRYTSYPPATHFTEEVSFEELFDKMRDNGRSDRDLSLYFHIPFCWSLCWFCGCNTVITTDRKASGNYISYLEKEMALMSRMLNREREVVQLHFGGGTPTFLAPEDIRTLGRSIRSNFELSKDLEAGVEIDPRRLEFEHLLALREAGFNRASIGVQDHDPKVQKAVHRIQPLEQTQAVVNWIRETGFASLNIDLIYGLPFQTPETFERTIDDVLALQPDRFAVFSYAHVPWMKPAQKILGANALAPELKLELLKLTIEKLTSAGYVYIGMDHFARESDELALAQKRKTLQRNFQGYSTREGADIYAFGMSSISQADGIYWQNIKELAPYCASLDEQKLPIAKGYILTDEDFIRRQTIMRLMCDLGLDYDAMSSALKINFREHFAAELDSLGDMEADGLVARGEKELSVTEAGRLFIRNIAMRFDAYNAAGKEGRFSRTI